jgi:hypothetical protein
MGSLLPRPLRWLAGIAMIFALAMACNPNNSHVNGEQCSPYAQGSDPDAGQSQGDCQAGLYCVCALGGCVCANFCNFNDGGSCPTGYSCEQARNVGTQSTGSYCLPDGGTH